MTVPATLQHYLCGDYFASEWAGRGCWDDASQLMVVVPAAEVEEYPDLSFLAVGRAGVDGILFGYRAGSPGLWAYRPIGREFEWVAASLDELVRGWLAGDIRV